MHRPLNGIFYSNLGSGWRSGGSLVDSFCRYSKRNISGSSPRAMPDPAVDEESALILELGWDRSGSPARQRFLSVLKSRAKLVAGIFPSAEGLTLWFKA